MLFRSPGINDAKQDPSLMATRKDTGLIDPLTGEEGTPASMRENIELAKLEAAGDPIKLAELNQKYNNMLFTNKPYENYGLDRKSTRLNSSHGYISYAVFCLKNTSELQSRLHLVCRLLLEKKKRTPVTATSCMPSYA